MGRCGKGSWVADGRWRISVTPPDWGQDHLSVEAVAAYVDGELGPGPHERASRHLGQCPECAAQVSAQGQARKELRAAGGPCMPSTLLSSLRAIPQDTDLPGPPPGLAMTADGQLVSMLRAEHAEPPTVVGFRADVSAPLHHGAVPRRVVHRTGGSSPVQSPTQQSPAQQALAQRRSVQRRLRVGTGVAVSGLALGALVFGLSDAPTAPAGTTPSGVTPTAPRGLPGVVDARLDLGPGGPGPAVPDIDR